MAITGRSRLAFAALAGLLVAGCGADPAYSVTGNVTLNGEPLAAGQIFFADADAATGTSFSEIRDGRYSLQTAPGAKQVRISSPQATGRTQEQGMGVQVPETIEQIPPRYNTQTELSAEVTTDGANAFDFALTAP